MIVVSRWSLFRIDFECHVQGRRPWSVEGSHDSQVGEVVEFCIGNLILSGARRRVLAKTGGPVVFMWLVVSPVAGLLLRVGLVRFWSFLRSS